MSFKIAVDTGGTFTDVVLTDADGRFSLSKAPTTPRRIFDGIGDALAVAARQRSLELDQLLGDTELLIYATTHSTNAILTGTTARTALITTKGFRDTLTFREGGKLRPFDFRHGYPHPYVPRELTFEVRERITSEGEVLEPLDAEEVKDVLAELGEHDLEAVAVSLLWSIANPVHEERIGELLDEHLPGVPYTLSSRLNPIIREYRRTSSAAIDASLKPLMHCCSSPRSEGCCVWTTSPSDRCTRSTPGPRWRRSPAKPSRPRPATSSCATPAGRASTSASCATATSS
jgi:N-methylhydantoinase A